MTAALSTDNPEATIGAFRELLRRADELTPEEANAVNELSRWYVPEAYMVPSKNPGVFGFPGASPKQLEFIRDFERHEARCYAIAGSNQCGKTTAIGCCIGRHLRDKAQDGDVYWVMAATDKTLRDIPCKTLWETVPKPMWGDKEYQPNVGFGDAKVATLTLPEKRGTCEIWFWTEDQAIHVVESARINGVWWTECASEEIFGALWPRLAARQGWMLMDYIPRAGWHREQIRLAAKTNPDIRYYHFIMQENAHNLPEGEVDRQRRAMSEQMWRIRGLGLEAALEGVVYPQFQEDRHVIPRFDVPKDWPRWRFLDYGRTHPTAVGWGTVAPVGWTPPGRDKPVERETRIVYQEYVESGRSIKQNAEAIRQRSKGEKYVGKMLIDPQAFAVTASNPLSIAQQYAKERFYCRPWKRARVYGEDAMVEMVRKELEDDGILVCENCPRLITEFQTWTYKKNARGVLSPADKYEDRMNDMLDATRGWLADNPHFSVRKVHVNYTGD